MGDAAIDVGSVNPADLERALWAAVLPEDVRAEAEEWLEQRRRCLGRTVCSESWLQHCWASGDPYPPSADTTPMIRCQCDRCRRTGRIWPATYGVEGTAVHGYRDRIISYECYLESLSDWEAAQLPSSPSGLAMRAIREGRVSVRFRRTRIGSRR